MEEIESRFRLRGINELLKEEFNIPSYQRGYRWTKKEVKALLVDIYDFYKNVKDGEFYCLQPLIVTWNDKIKKWDVVDGQQRLTSIFLILDNFKNLMTAIKKSCYSITYETRLDSEEFLKNIDFEKRNDNIDYYHICEAKETITSWFEEKDRNGENIEIDFLNTIINDNKNVQFIWFEIDNVESIDIFTRINMGKIPLTNAELIKALFLRSKNFDNINDEEIKLKQIEIATQWDNIENTLQNDSFWFFINDNSKKYETRIEFIFDLIKGNDNNPDELFTFLEYNKDFESDKKIEEIWYDVKKYFLVLDEWYRNDKLYHYVGYCITTKSISLETLIQKSLTSTKSGFENYIKGFLRDVFKKVDVDDLRYSNSHNRTIKNVLLLFNIESILMNDKSNLRFPFNEYINNSWDLEHITSLKSDMPSQKKSRKWLLDVFEYFNGSTMFDYYDSKNEDVRNIVDSIGVLLENEDYSEDQFREVYNIILSFFDENSDDEENEINGLSNLTLLDAKTNRGYGNAIFPIKRKWILENDKNALFVPLCTKNIFLKYYSCEMKNVMFWQKSDAEDYMMNIKETLKFYLN